MWTCECSRAFSISVKSSSSFVPSAPPTFSLTLCKTNKPKKKKKNYQAGKSWKGEMLQVQEVEEISVILSDDVK